ncbi:amino acid transporter [Nocardioides baekrokdamisoli]|uniref:Amino acid transporter n=1 Tax=Nocardioides baekrokdamisoli TaxID=1804624 RepID=A0A3G9J1F9_9ACTN|nr:LysE/ArgO family amino acid transporter [Nocardioides baekrokdamisoli]BBH17304.1 amino acid transporter [Nocardioides baekrokdamisoli]
MAGLVVVGFFTGLSLIIAIGAQNAYVLRQGILRSHVLPLVALCALSDVVLEFSGVAGIGVLITNASWVLTVVRWFGVAFLLWYAASSLRRARHATGLAAAAGEPPRKVLVRAAALTWLNPHVYLDTVILLGSIANAHGSSGRWWFAAGSALGSIVWFTLLGYGARLLAPLLARPRAWQILDVLIAILMVGIAAGLAFP